jgi:glycosyltransferase involved in cell wall biosynthesis
MKNEVALTYVKQTQGPTWRGVQCRLLYLVGQLRLGGLERQFYYLLANLDHARYQPAVVVWNVNLSDKYYRDIEALKIPIYGFPAEWSPLSKLRAFRALARQVSPEVIHSYGFHTNFAAYYAAWGTRALAIGSLRSEFTTAKKVGGFLRGALNARWPAWHISNSSKSAEAARRNSGLFVPKHFSVVRNALDLNSFCGLNDRSETKTYVAAVGSLFPVKRWDRLLRVVQKVKSLGAEGVRIRIAGDGPLLPILKNLATDLGISRDVEFKGAIQDMPTFLRRAKFLVHTSESEGCPNAVMEAMACGLPVVAMEAGDIPYLVEEGRTGFVVPQGEETTFAERICQLLRDDELCMSMGMAAQRKAEREFRLERLVSETLAVYKAAGWKDGSVGSPL